MRRKPDPTWISLDAKDLIRLAARQFFGRRQEDRNAGLTDDTSVIIASDGSVLPPPTKKASGDPQTQGKDQRNPGLAPRRPSRHDGGDREEYDRQPEPDRGRPAEQDPPNDSLIKREGVVRRRNNQARRREPSRSMPVGSFESEPPEYR